MKISARALTAATLALVLAGGVGVAVREQNRIGQLRAEHQTLADEGGEAQRLAGENQDIPRLRQDKQEADKLRESGTELLRLRNEATQLRGQAKELAALQAENQRLVAQGKSIVVAPNRGGAAVQPDFVPKAALRDAGLATPEAAVQTFFWSLSQGDVNRLQQCFATGSLPPDAFSESNRKDMVETGNTLVGFRITDRKNISPDEVMLGVFVMGIHSVYEGDVTPMTLKRVGNEWKMSVGPVK